LTTYTVVNATFDSDSLSPGERSEGSARCRTFGASRRCQPLGADGNNRSHP